MRRWLLAAFVSVLSLAATVLPGTSAQAKKPPVMAHVNHLVVIYMENRSFDNLYGLFSGANGLAQADPAHTTQVDLSNNALACLGQIEFTPTVFTPPLPEDQCATDPTQFANRPFNIDKYNPNNKATRDLVHRYYQNQVQIDGGLNDRFTIASDAKGLTQGYYETSLLPLAAEAEKYTLADNFFQAAFGGSFLNHQWLIGARTPVFPNAPRDGSSCDLHSQLDSNGLPLPGKDRALTTYDEGDFAVNTIQPTNPPFRAGTPDCQKLPNQTFTTIGDELTDAGVSWAWYSGGWNDAVAGHPDPLFMYHHQPFNYYANYAPGTPGRDHLQDETVFLDAARAGTLPAVSFVKPIGAENEHPGYTDVLTGELHAMDLIKAVRNGPDWKDSAIVLTYDENGGFWDHASPPVVDRWGPGSRVPTLIISPWAKKRFVDHTDYDTTSILATIEHRWNLAALSDRDAEANDLGNAFRG